MNLIEKFDQANRIYSLYAAQIPRYFKKNIKVKKSIKIVEKLIKGQGRILVRKSGTESKIRVMVESNNEELLNNCINIISKRIK